ncbi:MAG: trypsin-like peptidase domain-containing protein [Gammaproteobacteria bacterium]
MNHRERPAFRVFALLVTLGNGVCLGAPSGEAFLGNIDASVVCIESFYRKGVVRMGSGFVVAPGVIATVSHQINAASRIVVHFSDEKTQEAKLWASASGSDVALLTTPKRTTADLSLETDRPSSGEVVFTIGCPFGLHHAVTQGVVSDPDRLINGKSLIQTNVPINPGNSGGPLMNRSGAVLGLVHGILKETGEIQSGAEEGTASKQQGLAIPAREVIALMVQIGLNRKRSDAPDIAGLWQRATAATDPSTRIALFQEITYRAPWLTEAIYNQGIAYFEAGDYATAQQHYLTAVRQRPDYYQAYTNLGLVLHKIGEQRKAKEALIKAITLNPQYALAYLNLGIVYHQGFGDKESARRSFLRFLELDPKSPQAQEVQFWLKSVPKTSTPLP